MSGLSYEYLPVSAIFAVSTILDESISVQGSGSSKKIKNVWKRNNKNERIIIVE